MVSFLALGLILDISHVFLKLRGTATHITLLLTSSPIRACNPTLGLIHVYRITSLSGKPQGDATFADWLKDGSVICEAMNALKPGAIKKINASKMAFKQMVRTLPCRTCMATSNWQDLAGPRSPG